MNGSARQAGVTFYTRGGKTVIRSSHSKQPERRSQKQFDVRMRTKHNASLWTMLKATGEVHFYGEGNAYSRFRALAFPLQAVYTSKGDHASFLMNGIPVSEGSLPTIKQHLGTVNGKAALVTDLKKGELTAGETLLLFDATQKMEGNNDLPCCRFNVREVKVKEMTATKDGLALVDDEFADETKGWALVRVMRQMNRNITAQSSTQTIVTRCNLWERYTTPEAMKASLETYGGIKEK